MSRGQTILKMALAEINAENVSNITHVESSEDVDIAEAENDVYPLLDIGSAEEIFSDHLEVFNITNTGETKFHNL